MYLANYNLGYYKKSSTRIGEHSGEGWLAGRETDCSRCYRYNPAQGKYLGDSRTIILAQYYKASKSPPYFFSFLLFENLNTIFIPIELSNNDV
jgi:hypothetical protein